MSRTIQRTLLASALIILLACALLFTLRAVRYAHRARGEETIRPWMSVPYIAHSRHVPQNLLWQALGIPPHTRDHRPIGRIARQEKKPVDELLKNLREAIVKARKDQPRSRLRGAPE